MNIHTVAKLMGVISCLVFAATAFAQVSPYASVSQKGSVTSGQCAIWASNGLIQGGACGGAATSITRQTTLSGFPDTDVWFTDGTAIGQDSGLQYTKGTQTLKLGSFLLSGPSSNTLKFGADSATPNSITINVPNVASGTTNGAGSKTTYTASLTTGSGVSGGFDWQLPAIGSSGTASNSPFDAMTFSQVANLPTLNFPTNTAVISGVLNYDLTNGAGGLWSPTALAFPSNSCVAWSSTTNATGSQDTFACRGSAATVQIGGADSLTPPSTKQTIQAQSILAGGGTPNLAGPNLIIGGGKGTGTQSATTFGNSGIEFMASLAGSSGSTQNALSNVLDFGISIPNAWDFHAAIVGSSTITAVSFVRTGGFLVSTLPAGATGARAYVTDAVACVFMSAPTGSGSVVCPVFYNGTAWVGG